MKQNNITYSKHIQSLVNIIKDDLVLPIIITHRGCMDGYGSVLAVAETFGVLPSDLDIKYCHYTDTISDEFYKDIEGRDVIIADFSFSSEVMDEITRYATIVLATDHHKTSKELFDSLDYAVHREDLSGATLIWDVLNNGKDAPLLLRYIEDRDLWNWSLPKSKEVSAGLQIYKDDIVNLMDFLYNVDELISIGTNILHYENSKVKKVTNNVVRCAEEGASGIYVDIDGYKVPCINTTTLISEIGNELSLTWPMVVMYFITDTDIVFSLRSNENLSNHVDVERVARKFGGGGHKHAAGFSFKLEEFNYKKFFVDRTL